MVDLRVHGHSDVGVGSWVVLQVMIRVVVQVRKAPRQELLCRERTTLFGTQKPQSDAFHIPCYVRRQTRTPLTKKSASKTYAPNQMLLLINFLFNRSRPHPPTTYSTSITPPSTCSSGSSVSDLSSTGGNIFLRRATTNLTHHPPSHLLLGETCSSDDP